MVIEIKPAAQAPVDVTIKSTHPAYFRALAEFLTMPEPKRSAFPTGDLIFFDNLAHCLTNKLDELASGGE